MRIFRPLTLACAFVVSPLLAFACPAPMDFTSELNGLMDQARAAETESGAREASEKMWQLWLTAPDEAAQEVLDTGLAKRSSYDYAGAFAEFGKLIDYCPEYAEGYNQRAFVSYLRDDFPAALVDLDKALSITPDHIGAQSGRALTLMRMGRIPEAREQMLAALENNPWLSERALVAPGAVLGPIGQDI